MSNKEREVVTVGDVGLLIREKFLHDIENHIAEPIPSGVKLVWNLIDDGGQRYQMVVKVIDIEGERLIKIEVEKANAEGRAVSCLDNGWLFSVWLEEYVRNCPPRLADYFSRFDVSRLRNQSDKEWVSAGEVYEALSKCEVC